MDKNKKVLVTGGAGYVGSRLVKTLVDKGFKVKVFDKMIFGDVGLSSVKDKIEIVIGNIQEIEDSVLDDVEAIIHLAGYSTEPTSQYSPRYTDLVNHIATERLARLAKKKGISRFVFASSASVYFTFNTPTVPISYKESDVINPISAYSLSKRAAEEALLELADNNFKPTIFRKATIFGWSPRLRLDLVFNSFVKDAYFKKQLTVDAGGKLWRPMIHIQDAVNAYIAAIELPIDKVGGKIFNVVNENHNIGDLAVIIQKIIKEKRGWDITIDTRPVSITRNYQMDGSLFIDTFNLTPEFTLERAAEEMLDFFDKNENEDFKKPMYYNDLWQKKMLEEGKLEKI